ncbi:hypothetical protein GCM10025331_27380 [Actinoplanes utahensis]|nr:hypothetical protein Aut01nite_39170 [Actinoplanes utahensis]
MSAVARASAGRRAPGGGRRAPGGGRRAEGAGRRAEGASLRDIMARMGHDSPGAAQIYQHTDQEADHGIADAMDRAVKAG